MLSDSPILSKALVGEHIGAKGGEKPAVNLSR